MLGTEALIKQFDLVDAGSDCLVKVCADGKINLLDIPALFAPVKAGAAAVAAFPDVMSEARDIDADELQALIDRAQSSSVKLQAAVEALKSLKAG